MDLLSLPRGLRMSLQEIWRGGGKRSLHVELDYSLVQELRELFYNLASSRSLFTRGVDEFLEPERFERKVTYCLIRLRESGVPHDKYSSLLRAALEEAVRRLSISAFPWVMTGTESLDEVIIHKLADCFLPHYYPDRFLHYEILEEHALIVWDFSSESWRLTNLGEYARGLNMFSLVLFLLGIEFSFARENRRGRYPTMRTAQGLLAATPSTTDQKTALPIALRWYGIIENTSGREPGLTEFGRQLLVKATSSFNELRDLTLLLTESEHHGFSLSVHQDRSTSQPDLMFTGNTLTTDQRSTYGEISRLHHAGSNLDALRLLYPLIEGVLNTSIIRHSIAVAPAAGMHVKIGALVNRGILPSRLGSLAEIVTSRNKVVHGNIDSEDNLLEPLFRFVEAFFREVLSELEAKSSLIAHNTVAAPDR